MAKGNKNKKSKYASIGGIIVTVIIALLAFFFYSTNFSFWLKDVTSKSKHTKEEAVSVLEAAQDIHFKGDLDRVNNKALITVDNELYANTFEKGVFDIKFSLKCNKDTIFYFKSYDAADGEFGNEESATSFAVYNDKDEIYEYVHEALCTLPDGTREFVYNFYDINKNRLPVYFSNNTKALHDWSDGHILVETNTNWSGITKIFDIDMTISEPDKVDLVNIFLAFLEIEDDLTSKKNRMTE